MPAAIYLLPQRLDKTSHVGTAMVFVAIVNFAKIPLYAMLGLFTREALQTALVLSPFAPLGIWFGMWFHKRTPNQSTFYAVGQRHRRDDRYQVDP